MSLTTNSAEEAADATEWAYGGLDGTLSDNGMWVARAKYEYRSGKPIEVEVLAKMKDGEVLDPYGLDCRKLYVTQRAGWMRHPSAILAGDLTNPADGETISDRHAVMAAVAALRRRAARVSGATGGLKADIRSVMMDDNGLVKMPSVTARLGAISMAIMAEVLYHCGHDGKWQWLASDGSRRQAREADRMLLPTWREFLARERGEYQLWNWAGIEPLTRFLRERYPQSDIDWAEVIAAVDAGNGDLPPLP